MIDRFLRDAVGALSCQFWSTVHQCGAHQCGAHQCGAHQCGAHQCGVVFTPSIKNSKFRYSIKLIFLEACRACRGSHVE